MNIQTVNYLNEKSTDAPPSYDTINVGVNNNVPIVVGNINQGAVATYTIYKSGCFKTRFVYQNDNENKSYNAEVGFRSAKLVDNNGLPILKLSHAGFAFTTTTWNISYLVKNPKTYSSVQLVKRTFEFLPEYKLIFRKYDNTTIVYIFTLSSILGSSWNLSCYNRNVLKYNHHFFKKNTLVQYCTIDDEQFNFILLALSFLSIDHEHRKHRSNGGGP